MDDLAKHDDARNLWQKLKPKLLEMGQLKSNFDMEMFTAMHEGPFIAHQYHFVARQLTLAVYELRRMYLDREERIRWARELDAEQQNRDRTFWDIEIARHQNEIDFLEIQLVNKVAMVTYMCKLMDVLEEKNGGPVTNKQYQEEVPDYWNWFLKRQALLQVWQRETGISEGVLLNMWYVSETPPMTPEFQIPMIDAELGRPNIQRMAHEVLALITPLTTELELRLPEGRDDHS